MQLLGIVGSVTSPSKTRAAVEVALDAADRDPDVRTETLHLAEFEVADADGRRLAAYDGDTAKVLDRIVEADAYVVGSPVYRASYAGVLKNLFDLVPRGRWMADVAPMADAAVGLVMTGATPHHFLAVDEQLRSVMAAFGAHTLGGGVYAHDDHFANGAVTDEAIGARLETLGRATAELGQHIEDSDHLDSLGPQI